jgi:hypothetical protein
MAIPGKELINVGTQNQQVGSDTLFVAFNKINNNFTSLFDSASPYVTFVAGNGISTSANSSLGSVTIENSGVTTLTPGTGISLSGSNGNVTISVSGDITGNLVAGVTSIGLTSNTLNIVDGPVVGAGNIKLELPVQANIYPNQYINPVITVDEYGRVTKIEGSSSSGTVTSVSLIPGDGIAVTGGPITNTGAIRVTNTGVTKLTAGPGVSLSGSNGSITISATTNRDVGSVQKIGLTSNSLITSNTFVTTIGNLTVDLPPNVSITDNLTANGNITANANLHVGGNITLGGKATFADTSKIKINGGTPGYLLQTDGTGNLSWTAPPAPTESPGGSLAGVDKQVQFNDEGSFGADHRFIFNKNTGVLQAPSFSGIGTGLDLLPAANLTGNLTSANVTGNISASGMTVSGNISATRLFSTNTPPVGTRNTRVASTTFVGNEITHAFSLFGLSTTSPVNLSIKANTNSPVFTGTPTAPTPSQSAPGSNALATTAYVKTAVDTLSETLSTTSGVPSGAIIMWSGSTSNIPTGWLLCNGNNGTPNLVDRFVVGAGGAYNPNVIGGSANSTLPIHTHGVNSTFYGQPMQTHGHSIVDYGHSHVVEDPGHGHNTPMGYTNIDQSFHGGGSNRQWGTLRTQSATTGISIKTATSGVSVNPTTAGTPAGTVATIIETAGINPAGTNLPPYYALCYIMKQ